MQLVLLPSTEAGWGARWAMDLGPAARVWHSCASPPHLSALPVTPEPKPLPQGQRGSLLGLQYSTNLELACGEINCLGPWHNGNLICIQGRSLPPLSNNSSRGGLVIANSLRTSSYSPKPAQVCIWIPCFLCSRRAEEGQTIGHTYCLFCFHYIWWGLETWCIFHSFK